MGLLQGTKDNRRLAETHLKAALHADSKMAPAAYNLCVLIAADRPDEALSWCRKAMALQPEEPRYAFTLAYFLEQQLDKGAEEGTKEVRRISGLSDNIGEYRIVYGTIPSDHEEIALLTPAIA